MINSLLDLTHNRLAFPTQPHLESTFQILLGYELTWYIFNRPCVKDTGNCFAQVSLFSQYTFSY